MALSFLPTPPLVLPWMETREDRAFVILVWVLLILFLISGIVVDRIALPEPERKELTEVAPRLAQLIMEKKKEPPPPPPEPPKPEIEKKEPEKPKEVKPKDEPKPKILPKEDKRQAAREKAKKSGLIAMQDELADLRESFDFSDIGDLPQSTAGTEAETIVSASDVLSSSAGRGSGGIRTDTLNRTITRSELAQKQTTQVTSELEKKQQLAAKIQPKSRGAVRSYEEIERVFQKNKGSIFNIYNRELRKDPTLQGKVVLELVIAPDGTVISCKVLTSEVKSKRLESRLVSRVKQFRFSSKKVPEITVTYPIEFLPS